MIAIRGFAQLVLQNNHRNDVERVGISVQKIKNTTKALLDSAQHKVQFGLVRLKVITENLVNGTHLRVSQLFDTYILPKPSLVPAPLHKAIDADDMQQLEKILKEKPFKEKELESALMYALLRNRQVVVIALLDRHLFSLDIKSKVLSFAAARNNAAVVDTICRQEKMPSDKVQDAFFHAVSKGHLETLKMLLRLYHVEKTVYASAIRSAQVDAQKAVAQLIKPKV